MEVEYADKRLEAICTDEREMRKKRADVASKLKLRVNALEEAKSVGDLQELDPLGYWHELSADRPGYWSGRLSRNHRIIFLPDGEGLGVDAVAVTVIELTDYH